VSWAWIARLPDPANDALAQATLSGSDGARLGWLVAWRAGRKPTRDAVRLDAAVLDPDGAPGWASLILLPRDRAPLFDDPAVSGALRDVLAGPPPDIVSTFVRDATHFAGAVTVRRTWPAALPDDPFRRLAAGEILHVGAGLFGARPAVPGPVIQRYAGLPWPAAGFAVERRPP
jgi:hypothetical protein